MATIKTIMRTTALSSVFLLTACGAPVTSAGIPEEGLTVSQLYYQTLAENDTAETIRQLMPEGQGQRVRYSGALGQKMQKNQALIKALNNPSVPIFVYPHVVKLGEDEVLKPGYTTQFYLYKRNHFAMNSERHG